MPPRLSVAGALLAILLATAPSRPQEAQVLPQGATSRPRAVAEPGSTAGSRPPLNTSRPEPGVEAGRLLVVFFEKDSAGSRLSGLVRATRQTDALLQDLGPQDRRGLHSVRLSLVHRHGTILTRSAYVD